MGGSRRADSWDGRGAHLMGRRLSASRFLLITAQVYAISVVAKYVSLSRDGFPLTSHSASRLKFLAHPLTPQSQNLRVRLLLVIAFSSSSWLLDSSSSSSVSDALSAWRNCWRLRSLCGLLVSRAAVKERMVLNASAFVHTSARAHAGVPGALGWSVRSNSIANVDGIFFCSSLFQYTSLPRTDGLSRLMMFCSLLNCACVSMGLLLNSLG